MFVIYFLISVVLRIFIGVEILFRKKFFLVKKKSCTFADTISAGIDFRLNANTLKREK